MSSDDVGDSKLLIGPPKIKNIWRDFANCGIRDFKSQCGDLSPPFDSRCAERGNIRRPRGTYDVQDTVLAYRRDDESISHADHLIQQVTTIHDFTGEAPSGTVINYGTVSNCTTARQERIQSFQQNGDTDRDNIIVNALQYPRPLNEFLSQDPSMQLTQTTSDFAQDVLQKTGTERHQSQLGSVQFRELSSYHNQHGMYNNHLVVISEEQSRQEVKIRIRLPAEVSSMDPRDPNTNVVTDDKAFEFTSDISILRTEVLQLQVQWAEACADRLAAEKEKERAEREKDTTKKEASDLKDRVSELAAAIDVLRKHQIRKRQQSEEEVARLKRQLGELQQFVLRNGCEFLASTETNQSMRDRR